MNKEAIYERLYHSYGFLPYSQLPDITDPNWKPPPLAVERVGEEGQYLLDLGLAHRSDLGNPHHHTLLQYGASFMAGSRRGKRIMLYEGGPWPIADTLDIAYATGGEPMWMVTCAAQTKTEAHAVELPNDGADLLLALSFTREEIACYYFVRQAPQWERATIRPDFEVYIKGKMETRGERLGWDFDFSYSNLVEIYEGIYNKHFDPTETRFFLQQSVGYMFEPTTRIQQAGRCLQYGRDINLFNTQLMYLSQGLSVWTTFGWSHIRAILPALEKVGTHGETTYIDPKNLGSLGLWHYES